MKNVFNVSIQAMSKKAVQKIEGGGWIADAVERILCDCHWNYPAGSYHSAMMMRGI
jgi:hypothetical protein